MELNGQEPDAQSTKIDYSGTTNLAESLRTEGSKLHTEIENRVKLCGLRHFEQRFGGVIRDIVTSNDANRLDIVAKLLIVVTSTNDFIKTKAGVVMLDCFVSEVAFLLNGINDLQTRVETMANEVWRFCFQLNQNVEKEYEIIPVYYAPITVDKTIKV